MIRHDLYTAVLSSLLLVVFVGSNDANGAYWHNLHRVTTLVDPSIPPAGDKGRAGNGIRFDDAKITELLVVFP